MIFCIISYRAGDVNVPKLILLCLIVSILMIFGIQYQLLFVRMESSIITYNTTL